jgi:hypothetical protein
MPDNAYEEVVSAAEAIVAGLREEFINDDCECPVCLTLAEHASKIVAFIETARADLAKLVIEDPVGAQAECYQLLGSLKAIDWHGTILADLVNAAHETFTGIARAKVEAAVESSGMAGVLRAVAQTVRRAREEAEEEAELTAMPTLWSRKDKGPN